MQQKNIIIRNAVGLHARPAAQLVKLAKQFKSSITITSNNKTINAKSLILILGLAVRKDAEITITTEGIDEQAALTALTRLIEQEFSV